VNEGAAAVPGVTHWEGPPLEAWHAWSPADALERLRGVEASWCVVGGWSIDLFLGTLTRTHDDLEIAIPRGEFPRVRARLGAFELYVVGDGEVRKLATDAEPPIEKHQTWVLDRDANAWRMDVMLEPGDATTWTFRRDTRIRAPRSRMIGIRDGIPYLKPEGALLFKAKAATRAKDEADFAACLPHLDPQARRWLREALAIAHPGHPWLERLAQDA
jgi:aminoglycoside-2''-adenylyltransferase